MSRLSALLQDIQQCRLCAAALPFAPRPVVQLDASARLLIIGQAPSLTVQHTGIAWNDASGERLRDWLGVDTQTFYDPQRVAVMPMGFCYPGRGASGDLPPRQECAPQWHEQILMALPNIRLTLLIGQYAQAYYLRKGKYRTLTERVRSWHEQPETLMALPHPSPRNQFWLKKNPWFEQDVLPILKQRVKRCLA